MVFFLKYKLGYTEDDATVLYHGFFMTMFAMCLFGGIISDVWLGKFKTIVYLSILCSIGCIVIVISAIPKLNLPSNVKFFVGLILIAIGSGGIRPCVAAFGGDQFKLPEQTAQVTTFFSLYYFAMNSGGLFAIVITPILRGDVHCFGNNDCFSLAFAAPTISMFISIGKLCSIHFQMKALLNQHFITFLSNFSAIFLIGKSSYTYKETSSQNMLVQVSKCITVFKRYYS